MNVLKSTVLVAADEFDGSIDSWLVEDRFSKEKAYSRRQLVYFV